MLFDWLTIPAKSPEISDVIVSFDVETLERKFVGKSDLIREFAALGNRKAVRVVEKISERADGAIEPEAADRMLVAAHCEMQRMSEEFQHGRRVAELLKPILSAIRKGGAEEPTRIVDIGCGTGFVIRWLAARGAFGEDVELIGTDFNPALVKEAHRLSQIEKLNCRFVVANAFRLEYPADVYLSTGILHHFRGQALFELFKAQNRPETRAFLHFDFHPSFFAPFGSWLFHAARMREPLAKHDGVLSAIRAHKSLDLLAAARAAAPDFMTAVYGTKLWSLPIPRVFHTLVGIRPQFREAFLANLGKRRIRSLGVIE